MSFAFVCHHNCFIVYQSLREKTTDNWKAVTLYSAIIALILALALGLGGYIIFNSSVQGDILNNFTSDSPTVISSKVLLAICMVLTYPVECFIARHCAFSILDYYSRQRNRNVYQNGVAKMYREALSSGESTELQTCDDQSRLPDSEPKPSSVGELKFILMTLFLWGTSTLLSLVFTDLAIVLSFTGMRTIFALFSCQF